MIKCPNPDCGYENVDGTQYCEACGEELPQNNGASTPMTAGSDKMIECPACGNMNPADNAVCEVCGADLHPGGTSQSAPPVIQAVGSTPPIGAASDPSANTGVGGMSAGSTSTPFDAGVGSAGSVSGAGSNPTAAPDSTGTASPPATAFMGDTGSGTGTALPTNAAPDVSSSASDTSAAGAMGTSPVVASDDATTPLTGPTMPAVPAVPDTAAGTLDTSTTPNATMAPTAGGELQPGKVKMVVEQGMTVGAQFVLGDTEMQVGREDTDEDIYPDMDLSDQDAGYVHRKHAQLKFENGKLYVTHLGGVNKTRVNNRPLPDNVPQEVKMGDKVAFGKVVMRVSPA